MHSNLEITNMDWIEFEKKFNISRTDVIEIKNIFRHVCKLFILKTDETLWNCNQRNQEIMLYELVPNHKWYKFTYHI